MTRTEPRLVWEVRGRDFYTSGRFDLFYSQACGYWIATDADAGRVYRGTQIDCREWCREQLELTVTA